MQMSCNIKHLCEPTSMTVDFEPMNNRLRIRNLHLPELHAQSTHSESCIVGGSRIAMTVAGIGRTVDCMLLIAVGSFFITKT